MNKLIFLPLVFIIVAWSFEGFAQLAGDGYYLWNSTSITYSWGEKTELYLGSKEHFKSQIQRLDYFHFDLIGYRRISKQFSLGLGLRQFERYQSTHWNPGMTYLIYEVKTWNPWDLKIKFANRLTAKKPKGSDSQFGLDNITNVDFFVHSTNMLPKPYLMEELFSSLDLAKIQTIRLYGGFHVFNKKHWGLDLYYCYWKTRSTMQWTDYNVLGLSTKVKI